MNKEAGELACQFFCAEEHMWRTGLRKKRFTDNLNDVRKSEKSDCKKSQNFFLKEKNSQEYCDRKFKTADNAQKREKTIKPYGYIVLNSYRGIKVKGSENIGSDNKGKNYE